MISSVIIGILGGVVAYCYRTLAMPAISGHYGLEYNLPLAPGISFFEVLSILCSIILVWYLPITQSAGQMTSALALIWGLLMLSYIDFYYLIIPNFITGPLWLLGMLVNLQRKGFTSIQSALIGSCVAYTSLWIIANTYYYLTKRIGLGGGDIKLFGVLGAWFGLEALPSILWVSSSSGLCSAIIWFILSHQKYHTPVPFGPFLAFGGFIYLVGYKVL